MEKSHGARDLYRQQGFGLRMGFGERPALVIVDMQNDFTDASAQTNTSRSSQAAIPHILSLRQTCRELGIPVFYSRGIVHPSRIDEGLWQEKSAGHRDGRVQIDGTWGAEICDELRPAPGEVVINKHKPSVFYGSDFDVYMRSLKIDTLVICGSSTSGCVRATATDAFMREIRPILPRECQVDRDEDVMEANLFDLDSKYADVIPLDETIEALRNLRASAVPSTRPF
jgi:nicotinamidase-related amidase